MTTGGWTGWPPPPPKQGLPVTAILLIVLAAVLVVGGVTYGVMYVQDRESHRQQVEQESERFANCVAGLTRYCE